MNDAAFVPLAFEAVTDSEMLARACTLRPRRWAS
jgi:hypothetical protein